ncbi:MAG: hypothetical protein GWN33_01000, partial [Gammaproteobacteria bacterium]|nr:hypothetical protein [Gammaproteobacteria bacterium]
MRKSLFFIAFLLVGCGGNGGDTFAVPGTGPLSTQHVPVISQLALSPNTVTYMEGDGKVVVRANIGFTDTGLDIQTLWVQLPDGTSIEFNESIDTATGTLAEEFTMSTEVVGVFTVEFWLVDKAGDSSKHLSADFNVVAIDQTEEWTNRLGGLPYVLNDVVWDGDIFVSVGHNGVILTSADGIVWTERESFTDVHLNAVAAYGAY